MKEKYKKIESYWYPKLIVIFTDIRWVLAILFILLLQTISMNSKDWMSAYGSIISMCGIFMITRSDLRKTIAEKVKDKTIIDGGTFGKAAEDENELLERREIEKDIKSARAGFWLVVFGTLWWGYGAIFYEVIEKNLK